jgi:hypothetical protein
MIGVQNGLALDGYVDGYDRYLEIEAGLGQSHL